MPKIIATDLDGTLFYPKDKVNMISAANLYFLQSFIDDGGEVILISGRSWDFCQKVIEKIGRKVSVISYNGGCVFDGEKLIKSEVIDNNVVSEIIEEVARDYHNTGVFLMSKKGLTVKLKYKSKLMKTLYRNWYRGQKALAENYIDGYDVFDEELKNGTIYKFMLFFGLGKRNRQKAGKVTSILREKYDHIEANWSENVVEITGKGVIKANSLRELCKLKGYKDEDVIVVGDSGNDISMFKEFPENSFCMNHAPESVKKYAKYTLNKFEDLCRYISK